MRDLGGEGRLRDLGATAVVAGLGDSAAPVYGVIDNVGGRGWPSWRTYAADPAGSPWITRPPAVAIAFAKLAEAI